MVNETINEAAKTQETPLFASVTPMTRERQYQFNIAHSFKGIIATEIVFILLGPLICWQFFSDNSLMVTVFCVVYGLFTILFPLFLLRTIKKSLNRLMKKSPLQDENAVAATTVYENSLSIVSTRLGETISKSVIRFENVIKIVQSKKLLFVYIGINIAHIIDGECMTQGNFDDLTAFLKAKTGKKFKVFRKNK